MSYRPSFYGGFPGPPANQHIRSHYQDNRHGYNPPTYGQPFQDVTYYSDPTIPSYFPASAVNQPYNGNRFYQADYGLMPATQFSPVVSSPEYYVDPNSSQMLPSASSSLPAEAHTHQYNVNQPSNSFSKSSRKSQASVDNASASGKSRRFSHQRNVKETSGTSGEVFSPLALESEEKDRKNATRHSIRFSHQRNEPHSRRDKKSYSSARNERTRPTEGEEAAGDDNFNPSTKLKSTSNVKGNFSNKKKSKIIPVDSRNQAGVLSDQLTYGTYECMVCCDRVRPQHAVWNCPNCYNLFHMGCIKKWARSPAAKFEDSGWRCPGCQNVTKNIPSSYLCYCGKMRNPEIRHGEVPHSCGEMCGRARRENSDCVHPCNILCHPGPCPQCPAMINKHCRCGKTSSRIRCSQQKNFTCDNECGKTLNCGLHECDVICHAGACFECDVTVEQVCHCGESNREIICGSDFHKISLTEEQASYSCGKICGKQLLCGNHFCHQVCHMGPCKSCSLLPSAVTACPCTQTKLSEMKGDEGSTFIRNSCLDPVPTCEKVCGKPLRCGGNDVHMCVLKCHEGDCPPCINGKSSVICRCGKTEKDIPCEDFVKLDEFKCDRRCNKKKKCGRHKCGQLCCVNNDHVCTLICGRRLTCGLHSCEELCHRGSCHTCYNVSFDELFCHCGEEVIYPPIPCGTKPPECHRECTRVHTCSHPVRHPCHSQEVCPPCIELVKKPCNCGKTIRSNIMCHIVNVSCGELCGKTLACGHKCLKPCHRHACLSDNEKCKQPCSIMRLECIHPCSTPCHSGDPCPSIPCKALITVKCPCGRREEHVECSKGGAHIQSINSALSAAKGSVDMRKLIQPGTGNYRSLSCDEECAIIERNKRFAEALSIETDEYGSSARYRYSEFLMNAAKHDGLFVRSVEKELMNLVEKVQWMAIAKHCHSFPAMKKDKRQVVHELAEAFKCKSESLDYEPKRNVVVTAEKGVSKHPTPLLSDAILEKPVSQKSASPKPARKGLLSSMKLVSYSSADKTREEDKSKTSDRYQRKPTAFATSGAYKPPHMKVSSSTFPPSTSKNSRDDNSVLAKNMSSLSLETKKSSTERSATSQTQESAPKIDYFDMTD